MREIASIPLKRAIALIVAVLMVFTMSPGLAGIVEKYPSGTTIKIHAAPTREGYTFLCWKGSEYYPGDSYTVTENHTFTAQWQQNAKPNTSNVSSSTNKSSSPRTGDQVSPSLPVALAILALVALAGMLVARKRGRG